MSYHIVSKIVSQILLNHHRLVESLEYPCRHSLLHLWSFINKRSCGSKSKWRCSAQQCYRCSRNIPQVTPKNMYFYYQKNTFLRTKYSKKNLQFWGGGKKHWCPSTTLDKIEARGKLICSGLLYAVMSHMSSAPFSAHTFAGRKVSASFFKIKWNVFLDNLIQKWFF